jgi:hypothetical protein
MIPETYNVKREGSINVCKACDWLCTAFRRALIDGDQDKAVALHATGNINLHSPFGNVKGELFYPVHCAVLGKNLSLLRWLVDENCCPIKSVRISSMSKNSAGKFTAIVTSKGRSLLGIAMELKCVDIVRYLVVDKGIILSGEKDVTTEMLVRNLDAALRLLPRITLPGSIDNDCLPEDLPGAAEAALAPVADFNDVAPISPSSCDDLSGGRSLSEEARDFGAVNHRRRRGDDSGSTGSDNTDECKFAEQHLPCASDVLELL